MSRFTITNLKGIEDSAGERAPVKGVKTRFTRQAAAR